MTLADILAAAGWMWLGAVPAFVLGCAWRAWTHRCKVVHVVGIHELDAKYALGISDERARREAEIRGLEEMLR